ncbi:MAG: FecR family protein [Candidatus Saccharibacteria bacterium]
MENINPELLRKFIAHQTNDEESVKVIQWLEANNLSLDDLKYALKNPKNIWIFDQIDAPRKWEVVKEKITARSKVISMRTFLRAAASILILVALAGIGFKVNEYKNRQLVVFNESSEVLKYILPDSSEVSLNKHSKLTYFGSFLKKRTINFEGEAFFEIKRDVNRPFVIQTAESNIKVLGTSFSVATDLNNTSVIVASGRVALFSSIQSSDTVFLEKGDMGVFKAISRSVEKKKNKDLNYLAWKTHRLVFDKTPIANVIADLERYFQVKVKIKSPEIYKLNYTSQFTNPTLAEVLKEMEIVLNIRSEVSGNNILWSLK